MKVGWKTSEFWVTLAAQIIGILVLFGVIGTDQSGSMNEQAALIANSVEKIVGAIITILSTLGYNNARAKVKIAEAQRR